MNVLIHVINTPEEILKFSNKEYNFQKSQLRFIAAVQKQKHIKIALTL